MSGLQILGLALAIFVGVLGGGLLALWAFNKAAENVFRNRP